MSDEIEDPRITHHQESSGNVLEDVANAAEKMVDQLNQPDRMPMWWVVMAEEDGPLIASNTHPPEDASVPGTEGVLATALIAGSSGNKLLNFIIGKAISLSPNRTLRKIAGACEREIHRRNNGDDGEQVFH